MRENACSLVGRLIGFDHSPLGDAKKVPRTSRIKFFDVTTDLRLVFLTNDFASPALTIVRLYKLRWQIELFFKWIKQHLRIKVFYGTSPNAVKTQIRG